MTPAEFSRTVPLDRIGTRPTEHRIVANDGERAALAMRFGLISIDRLEAEADLCRENDGVRAEGRVRGRAMQSCVVTGEPLAADVDTGFAIRCVRETPAEVGDELELDAEQCETMFFDGRSIDLGEIAAESFALSLDRFPRSPDAEAALHEAGVLGEEEAGPFGTLAELRRRLAG